MAGLLAERVHTLVRAAPTDFDDAYMYLRYAGNILAGHGPSWNSGEGAVHGVTSLLHLTVVTVLRGCLAALSPAAVLQLSSGGAAIGLLGGLVGIAALGCQHPRLRRNWLLWAAVILALVAYHEAFVFHAGTGMDTMLSAMAGTAVVLVTVRLARRPSVPHAAWAALVAVVAVLARPDNALCAFLCPVLAVALCTPRPRGRLLAIICGIFAVALAVLLLVLWLGFGSPLPLSFFAKQPGYYGGFAGEYGWNPFRFLEVFATSALPFLVATILFVDGAGLRRAAVLLVPALVSIAALFRFNQIMGHLGRFFYPFLPYFVAAGVLEFDAWLQRRRTGPHEAPGVTRVRLAMAAAVVIGGAWSLSAGAASYERRGQAQELAPLGGFHVAATAPLPEIDSWQSAGAIAAIAAAAPPGTTFAMSEHGLPGALAPHAVIIDVLGLHDPAFARQGFSSQELFRREPDFIWFPHQDHTRMLRDILDSDELWDHYDFYPDAFFHGVALRRHGPHEAQLAILLHAAWQKAYPGVAMANHRASRGDR